MPKKANRGNAFYGSPTSSANRCKDKGIVKRGKRIKGKVKMGEVRE